MLRTQLLVLTLVVISGCYVGPGRAVVVHPRPVVVAEGPPVYRYWGQHPIPYGAGGGWCFIEGEHVHPYLVENPGGYAVTNNVYYYRGPVACSYSGPHPVVGGGWCYLNFPHSHNYCPSAEYQSSYRWEPHSRAYVYTSPPPSYHGASPAYRPGPPPPHPGYVAPPPPGVHPAEPVNHP